MAAKDFNVDIQLNQNQILSGVFERLAAAPGSPVIGQFYYDTTLNLFRGWNGSVWKDLGYDTAGQMQFNSIISPPQITANQNNYNPTGLSTCNVMRLFSDGARDITGLQAQPNGTTIYLFNVGTGGASIKLKDQNANSIATNRFEIRADATIEAGEGGILWYDGTSQRWRLASKF